MVFGLTAKVRAMARCKSRSPEAARMCASFSGIRMRLLGWVPDFCGVFGSATLVYHIGKAHTWISAPYSGQPNQHRANINYIVYIVRDGFDGMNCYMFNMNSHLLQI